MPIYEYECKKCGEKFALRLGFFHSQKEIKCPKCGNEKPERILSGFATGGSASTGSSCSTGRYR